MRTFVDDGKDVLAVRQPFDNQALLRFFLPFTTIRLDGIFVVYVEGYTFLIILHR